MNTNSHTQSAAYRRDTVRALLILAATEESKNQQPTARFLNRATDLIAGRAPERADPMTLFARDLATLMASTRALLTDEAYAEVLPALQRLSDLLPDHLTPPPPVRSPRMVPEPRDPQDR